MNILNKLKDYFIQPKIQFNEDEINRYLESGTPEQILEEISKVFTEIIRANNFIHNRRFYNKHKRLKNENWGDYTDDIELLEQKVKDHKYIIAKNVQLLELLINGYFGFKYRIRVVYTDDIGQGIHIKGDKRLKKTIRFKLLKETLNDCRFEYGIGCRYAYSSNLIDMPL